jgi:hypothetical protein
MGFNLAYLAGSGDSATASEVDRKDESGCIQPPAYEQHYTDSGTYTGRQISRTAMDASVLAVALQTSPE